MLVGSDYHPLELPDFFKAFHAVDDGRDLSNESRRKASPQASTSKMKHGFLPMR